MEPSGERNGESDVAKKKAHIISMCNMYGDGLFFFELRFFMLCWKLIETNLPAVPSIPGPTTQRAHAHHGRLTSLK